MKKLVFLLVTLFSVGLIGLSDAEARRMGGGSNLGKQYSVPSQAARPAGPTSSLSSPAMPAAAGGASRWLGPLAGIAAGGLLAALLFGDGFQGLQILDFLILAAVAFGAYLLFRRLRRGVATPALAGAGAPNTPYQRQATELSLDKTPLSSSVPGSGIAAPSWFDEAGFLDGAKRHFVTLQAAWDQGSLESLREYTTPELFTELTRERARLGAERQETEVVTLDARLVGLQRDGDQAVASIQFSGLIRETAGVRPEPFREIWHVAHAWASPAGDWYLSGIQQVTD